MFTFIHTSDWHLGQNFYGYDRSEEHKDFLRQLADIVRKRQPDALLVSGDIYHTAAPSNAAVNLYVNAMLDIHRACPTMAIIVIAGNHDSASRLDSDKRLWELANVTVLGGIARDADGKANFDRHIIKVEDNGIVAAVPFAYPSSFPVPADEAEIVRDQRQQAYFQALLDHTQELNTKGLPVVLMAHLAVNNSDFTGHDYNMMESFEIGTLGTGYDYAALGHIHRPQQLSERARYSGTPIPVSFDERCEHSVSIVEIDSHGSLPHIETKVIKNLKPLHTVPADEAVNLEEALKLIDQRDDITGSYIRLHVKVDRFLPTGSQERAAQAVSDRKGYYCEIKKTASTITQGAKQQMTLAEFSSKQPIEIANQYLLDTTGSEMTDKEKEMFNYALRLVQEELRQ
jgi:exonuclease SbcD